MDDLRDRFAALDRIPVADLWSDIDRRVADAAAASRVHGKVSWRAERAPHPLSPMLIMLLLSLLLALTLALVVVGSRLPNLWTSVVPSPTPSVPTERIAVGPAPDGPPQPGGIAYMQVGPQPRLMLVDPSTRATRPLTPPLMEMLDEHGCARETDLDVQRSAFVDEKTWSPDGRALAFQLAVGHIEVSDPRPSCGLFVVSSDGQALQRLLPAPDWESPLEYSPAWAPDGSQIAVALGRSIALVPLDGSAIVDLGSPCNDCQPEVFRSIGGWSPDGSLIAAKFVDDGCCSDDTTYYIAVVDVATAEWTLLWSGTRDETVDEVTSYELIGWLPDGRVAARSNGVFFAVHPEEPSEWVPEPELGRNGFGDQRLWSPDGEQLAVVRRRGLDYALWVTEADGGNPRYLVSLSRVRLTVAWQPVWPREEASDDT